jgi:N6-L-threonylcarbamoyladenine synthase
VLILGLETSCDETAAAVLDCPAPPDPAAVRVLSDVVHTQVPIHRVYGGVVPELASRDHLARVLPVVDEALRRAGAALRDVDAFAATSGPGLVGALLVGVQTAKALAWARARPVVGVNHLEGHLLAILLEPGAPAFPYLALVVSGGHTALYDVQAPGQLSALGHTRDDAAGEAFDKVGKMLGLDYPAGRAIDELAAQGDAARFAFPRAMKQRTSFDFSFSGLKTAVLNHLQAHGRPQGQDLRDLCASFQEAVCDSLVTKAIRAAKARGLTRLVLGGGVAANSRLRALAAQRGATEGLSVHLPSPRRCTDNGAMIALAGAYALARRGPDALTLNADAAWRI